MYQPFAPTRDVLSRFLPNQLAIRAFEDLFAKNGMIAPTYTNGQLVVVSGGVFAGIDDVATGNALLSGGVGVVPFYGKVGLTTHVSGILPVANGGTALASGTSGGILGFTATGVIASSALLDQNRLVLGGGAGATPSTPLALGTTTQVLHGNAAGAPTWSQVNLAADVTGVLPIANGGSLSGTYTPTLTNVSNVSASTAYACQYMRVGNTVSVSGRIDVDPTSTALSTQIGISIPIASNFAASENCGGVAFCPAIAGQGAAIVADVANDRAQMEWISGDTTNQPMYFSFMYQVI